MFSSTWRSIVLVAGETVLLVAAVAISSVIIGRDTGVGPAARRHGVAAGAADRRGLPAVPALRRSVRPAHDRRRRAIWSTRLMRAIGATSLILGIAYWLFPLLVVERGVFLLSAVLAVVAGHGAGDRRSTGHDRSAWRRASGCCWSGTSPAAIVLARELFERRQELGVDIVGFVDPDPSAGRRAGHQPRSRRHASTTFPR